jgi:hypothetical protein
LAQRITWRVGQTSQRPTSCAVNSRGNVVSMQV